MDEIKLKMEEVASLLGESRHIVKNWLRDCREWVPTERGDNGYNLFGAAAVEKMQLIRQLIRERGYSMRQVQHHLAGGGELAAPVAADPGELAALRAAVEQLAAAQERQNDLSAQIVQQLAQQEQRANERDRGITELLAELREVRQLQLAAPASDKRPWWRFWRE